MYGRPRSITRKVIPLSTIHIRDILQRASLCKPSFICLPEHREGFIQATPSDPNPYSRAEMDEKLNDIYTVQYDSMNDIKCKLHSVYHPLNDKITWLTKTMETLADDAETTRTFSMEALETFDIQRVSTPHID
ncbi:hypothetical protein Bca101_057541 [Brassica carinata]